MVGTYHSSIKASNISSPGTLYSRPEVYCCTMGQMRIKRLHNTELGQCLGNSVGNTYVGQMEIGQVAAKVHYLLSLRELH